jgi:hypothetical protein
MRAFVAEIANVLTACHTMHTALTRTVVAGRPCLPSGYGLPLRGLTCLLLKHVNMPSQGAHTLTCPLRGLTYPEPPTSSLVAWPLLRERDAKGGGEAG